MQRHRPVALDVNLGRRAQRAVRGFLVFSDEEEEAPGDGSSTCWRRKVRAGKTYPIVRNIAVCFSKPSKASSILIGEVSNPRQRGVAIKRAGDRVRVPINPAAVQTRFGLNRQPSF